MNYSRVALAALGATIAYFVLGRRWPVASLRAGNGVGTRDMLALL